MKRKGGRDYYEAKELQEEVSRTYPPPLPDEPFKKVASPTSELPSATVSVKKKELPTPPIPDETSQPFRKIAEPSSEVQGVTIPQKKKEAADPLPSEAKTAWKRTVDKHPELDSDEPTIY